MTVRGTLDFVAIIFRESQICHIVKRMVERMEERMQMGTLDFNAMSFRESQVCHVVKQVVEQMEERMQMRAMSCRLSSSALPGTWRRAALSAAAVAPTLPCA